MTTRRALHAALLAAATTPLFRRSAAAQERLRGPVTLVVPWAAGGSADLLARLLAQQLSPELGQPVLVDNRPGASGLVGHQSVARARPDGQTILLAASATYAMVPHLLPMPYDNQRAFAPIGLIATMPMLACVSPRLGVTDMAGLVARAKAAPGRLSYASAGVGSSTHLAAELLLSLAEIEMLEVGYRGNAPAVQSVMADETQLTIVDAAVALPFVRSGELKAVGVTTQQRSPQFPDVPTVAESGYPDYFCATQFALLAPAGTPRAIIGQIHQATATALNAPELRERLDSQAIQVTLGTPEDFPDELARESARWGDLIRRRNIKAQ